MDAAHTVKGRSQALSEECAFFFSSAMKMSASPLYLPTHQLLILSLTGLDPAADLFNDVNEMSKRSPVAVLAAQSSICHDLYIARASKTDKRVVFCVRVSVCACAQHLPI